MSQKKNNGREKRERMHKSYAGRKGIAKKGEKS